MNREHSDQPRPEYFVLGHQEIVIDDFEAPNFILDIGGGGEGVIGRLKGKQVIAIDSNKRELEEADGGSIKIVMDARELKFLDGTFEVVTSFYSLMYIKSFEHKKVFEEIFRVLSPGGRVLIWDLNLPQRLDGQKDVAVIFLTIKLPDREIETGYGARWPDNRKDINHYKKIASETGFIVSEERDEGQVFFLKLQKI